MATHKPTPDDRFWANVEKTDGCWLWVGHILPNGYGRIGVNGARFMAHRYAWQMARGPIPDGMYVCHKCDVRRCVNLDHLFLGTHDDNMRDAAEKMRWPWNGSDRCRRGHLLTPDSVYVYTRTVVTRLGNERVWTYRHCKVCLLASKRRLYHARKASALNLNL